MLLHGLTLSHAEKKNMATFCELWRSFWKREAVDACVCVTYTGIGCMLAFAD
jgi:hypothetical protein